MASPTFDFSSLNKYDVYPTDGWVARNDLKDGFAGSGNWYNGPNPLPNSSVPPSFIAKNYGPKWLNSQHGHYQIVTPFVTGNQTDQEFAQGTITISKRTSNGSAPLLKMPRHTAFMMEEGQLSVTLAGYDTIHLIQGDVVFIPANHEFSYFAEAEFTKFMYVSGGGDGLDAQLIKGGKTWDKAFYPQDQSQATPGFGAPGISAPLNLPAEQPRLHHVRI